MASLQTNYDPDAVEAGRGDFEPVPAGHYAGQIVASEVVTPKSGQGLMLKLQIEIIDGPCQNRIVFDQLNYQHSNPTAQLIGQQTLKSICEAIGHTGNLDDSEMLHYRPFRMRVAVEQKDLNYAAKNVVKSYKPLDNPPTPTAAPSQQRVASAAQQQRQAPSQSTPAATPTVAAAARTTPPAGSTRPWGRAAAGR